MVGMFPVAELSNHPLSHVPELTSCTQCDVTAAGAVELNSIRYWFMRVFLEHEIYV